jgi:hypothetical protein
MATSSLTRADILRIVREECADTIMYSGILNRARDQWLVEMTIRGLWRSIEERIAPDSLAGRAARGAIAQSRYELGNALGKIPGRISRQANV